MRYLITLFILLGLTGQATAGEYTDTLIRVNSLKHVVNLLKSYDASYVEWDESGKAVAISQVTFNPIHSLPDNNTAGIVYLRGKTEVINDIMEKLPPYVTMLQKCPAKGNRVQTGVDEEGSPVYAHKKIYKLLHENPESMTIYRSFHPDYPLVATDPEGNVIQDWDEENQIWVDRPHPRAGQMRRMGGFM